MIAENITRIKNTIDSSNKKQRSAFGSEIKLVAVTKNHDVHAMREAIDAGISAVGENRVQEAWEKSKLLNRDTEWHLIGHLQTNKVKQAVALFDFIHSVDSERLALAIEKEAERNGKIQNIMIQVNVANEETKFGMTMKQARQFAESISKFSHLRLCGLMTIAPQYADLELVRPIFKQTFCLFKDLHEAGVISQQEASLSMGMTNDFTVAIEEGANLVRVGTGIFGQRQY